jgi:hypothetical protein
MMAAAVLAFALVVLMSYRIVAGRQRGRAATLAAPGA